MTSNDNTEFTLFAVLIAGMNVFWFVLEWHFSLSLYSESFLVYCRQEAKTNVIKGTNCYIVISSVHCLQSNVNIDIEGVVSMVVFRHSSFFSKNNTYRTQNPMNFKKDLYIFNVINERCPLTKQDVTHYITWKIPFAWKCDTMRRRSLRTITRKRPFNHIITTYSIVLRLIVDYRNIICALHKH